MASGELVDPTGPPSNGLGEMAGARRAVCDRGAGARATSGSMRIAVGLAGVGWFGVARGNAVS
eukprot:4071224-Lingulodinium_polyedra.AAC.1